MERPYEWMNAKIHRTRSHDWTSIDPSFVPMKTHSHLLFLAAMVPAWVLTLQPQINGSTRIESIPGAILDRGPHHRVQEVIHHFRSPSGESFTRTGSYVLLGTGLNYWEEGQWKETRAEIEIINGAAVARQGPIKVLFAANLNSPGAIDVLSPQRRRFRSHILGLAYSDAATGQSVLIAETKDSMGGVLPPNQVHYLDAFEGDVLADVRYLYTPDGFEQDIVLLAAPPSPAEWGLNPDSTRLEVWTEFIEAPNPAQKPILLRQEAPPTLRQAWAQPDLIDHHLDFGDVGMGPGYAFASGEGDVFNQGMPTAKQWVQMEGRVFLIEQVGYRDLEPILHTLPQMADNAPGAVRDPRQPAQSRDFPLAPAGAPSRWQPGQWAQITPHRRGIVLDYATTIGSLTNHVFQVDTTYFVTNSVQLYGTTVVEGGAVIKFSTGSPTLNFNGPVQCLTAPWHPAVFTARDDDSSGETVLGSTGTPSGTYALYPIACKGTGEPYLWRHIRVRYGTYGLAMFSGVTLDLAHAQIGSCSRAFTSFSGVTHNYANVLVHDVDYGFWNLFAYTNRMAQATFHRVKNLLSNTNNPLPALTNTLLIAVTNNVQYQGGADVAFSATDTGIFQTVAAGSRYLAASSPYLDVGTTNIPAWLAEDLATLTTHPPQLLTALVTMDTTLAPQAPRDLGVPSLGYHYDPIDYVAKGLVVSNAILVVTNGAVIGVDYGGTNYGINLDSGAVLRSYGRAEALNQFLMVHSVQENPMDYDAGHVLIAQVQGAASPTEGTFRFTGFPLLNQANLINNSSGLGTFELLSFQHSILKSGYLVYSPGLGGAILGLTNNCLDRFFLYATPTNTATAWFFNNLFKDGVMAIEGNQASYHIHDNYFHDTQLFQFTPSDPYHGHNGYIVNTNVWGFYRTNDVILTHRPMFLTGVGGPYYYSDTDGLLSTLINAGSRGAEVAGLYHFTTLTNQVKETNSTVDIGFHYVALDGNGLVWDTDGDGVADYLEDLDGDGLADAGETDWKVYESPNNLATSPSLQVHTVLE